MNNRSGAYFLATGLIFLCLSLFACSGGGGDSSAPAPTPPAPSPPASIIISGTASAGAPIEGNVYLKDSRGNTLGPVSISANGSFSFDATNMTPPFVLMAEGTTGLPCKLMSMATGGGTSNINPLTNLAVASLTGNSDAYANFNSNMASRITGAAIADIIAKIRTMLAAVLNTFSADINPITGSVPTNHLGLDGLFDVIKVNVSPSMIVTLVNKLTGVTIYTVNASAVAVGTAPVVNALDPNIPSVSSITALQEIGTRLNAYAAVLGSRGVNLTEADVVDYYVDAATFGIFNGYNKSAFIVNREVLHLNRYSSMTVMSISYIVPVPGQCDLSSNTCLVQTRWVLDDGSIGFPNSYQMTKDGGVWKITGNNLKAEVYIYPAASKVYLTDGTMSFENGLRMELFEPGNFNLEYAKVTGPGLPPQGVHFHRWVPYGVLVLDNDSRATNQWGHYIYYKELDIDAVPDDGSAQYLVQFYSDAARTILEEQQTVFVTSRPLKNVDITDAHFATLSHPTTHVLSSFPSGGSYAFTYAKPTAFIPGFVRYELCFWTDGAPTPVRDNFRKNGRLDATSGVLNFTKNPAATYGETAIRSKDLYDRWFGVYWELD